MYKKIENYLLRIVFLLRIIPLQTHIVGIVFVIFVLNHITLNFEIKIRLKYIVSETNSLGNVINFTRKILCWKLNILFEL